MNDHSESFAFNYKNVEHRAVSIGVDSMPGIDEIISVHALLITREGKVIAVNVRSRGVDLPGGHVEEREASAMQTLARELAEEANMTIKNPQLLDVLEISSTLIEKTDRHYIVIFQAEVDELGEFEESEEISDRLELSREEFSERYFAHAPNYIKYLFEQTKKS